MACGRSIARLLPLAVVPLALVACGGGGGNGTTTVVPVAGLTCSGEALGTEPELPPRFPKPGGITYVKAVRQGPTLVVDGYYVGELDAGYDQYREAFEAAGYTVLFHEQEAADAEVSYRDPAEETSGQVALKAACANGNVSLHITNRPA
jgi:hypothetical protein